ncbi:MAG: cyclic nucleotide-binding domain-containing protein, partial [Ilumatobacteraceae bacterium]
MARNDHRDHLRRVPLFADLGDHELDVVGAATTELDLSAGHTLIREGEIAHEMFVVVSGELEVRRGDEVVATIGAGGVGGARMKGFGSDPDYVANRGGAFGGVGAAGAGAEILGAVGRIETAAEDDPATGRQAVASAGEAAAASISATILAAACSDAMLRRRSCG